MLAVSAVLFFGVYGALLLLQKEQFVKVRGAEPDMV